MWNNDIKLLSMRMAPATIYLDVSNNDIMTLTTMEGGQSLVYLDASSNNIGRGGTGGMPHFGTLMMPCLEGVNLANNDIGPEVPPGGKMLPKCRKKLASRPAGIAENSR